MTRNAIETPFFFSRAGVRLFGVLHQPEDINPKRGFLFCHPFAEEKLWSHRVFVSFARALAQQGNAVLRFDFAGAGDSFGSSEGVSLDTLVSDVAAAYGELVTRQPGISTVGLIGLRLGASIASIFAEHAATDDSLQLVRGGPLILWDPIVDGEAYFQEVLRSNLSMQLAAYGKVVESREVLQNRIRAGGTVNVDGYQIGSSLFSTCAVRDLLPAGTKLHGGPTLVVQIAQAVQAKERLELRSLAESFADGEFARVTEQPFWREIKAFYGRAPALEKTTQDWLDSKHGKR